jgi:copper homeostasis protein (lipoprotein)
MKSGLITIATICLVSLMGCGGKQPPETQGAAPAAAPVAEVAPAALRTTHWKLVMLGGGPLPATADPERVPHLVFAADEDRVSGSGGCNRLSGTFTLEGDKLAFGPMMATKMACAEGGEIEGYFLIALRGVTAYRIIGDTLELLDVAGALVLRFEAVK